MLGNKAEILQMSFEVENTGRNLTSEYWDDHWSDDECPIDDYKFVEIMEYHDVVVKQQRAMRDRLREQIKRFSFLEGGVAVALAKFGKGSIFDPENYPHGTLIRVSSEGLNLRYMELGFDRYGTVEEFGFVVDTEGVSQDGKNAVMYVSRGLVFGGSPDKIEVGVVKHWKHQEDQLKEDRIERLSRVTGVDIVSMGRGFGRRIPQPSPVPSTQSRVLVPQPAK